MRVLRVMVLGLVCLAASACTSAQPQRLEDTCQFQPCVCADERAAFWQLGDKKPLAWRQNGEPYCPPGYGLKLTGETK